MRIYLLLIMLLINNIVYAFRTEDLYTVEIDIPSKFISLEQRIALINQEFPKVLKKIIGKSKSLPIENVDKYVSKYEYKDDNLAKNKVILKIFFDKSLINKTLIENNYAFLDEHRPVTIIWPKTSDLMSLDSMQKLLQQILITAKDRGLSVIYPILDLKEVEILNQDIIDEKFKNSIKQASQKYGADEIIIAKCDAGQDLLNISWSSIIHNWQFEDQLLENNNNEVEQANLFVDKLLDHFISIYTGNNTRTGKNKETVFMRINNVINLEDYVQVEKYLQNLPIINNLRATKFQPGEVEFEIIANGDRQAIKNAIASNNVLQENYNDKYFEGSMLVYTLNFS